MEKNKSKIIKKLMHFPGLSFNELWGKDGESNKFAYHLKVLEDMGLIEKKDNKYFLSNEGKTYALFINGETGEIEKQPLVNLILVVFNSDNEILLYERLKEPFYGYFGFPGAKLKFGEGILDCASRELKEETNLEADFEIAGFMNLKTFNNGKIAYHHTQYVLVGKNPKGELKKEDREGKFSWVSKDEFLSKKQFPDNKYSLEYIEKDKFFIVEMKRFQENDEFKEIEIEKEILY